jgi:hypothetical protein
MMVIHTLRCLFTQATYELYEVYRPRGSLQSNLVKHGIGLCEAQTTVVSNFSTHGSTSSMQNKVRPFLSCSFTRHSVEGGGSELPFTIARKTQRLLLIVNVSDKSCSGGVRARKKIPSDLVSGWNFKEVEKSWEISLYLSLPDEMPC